jgi:hypothetical protein
MSIYESEHCVVDHQNGPGQDYWFLADIRDAYDSAEWPTREAMKTELREILWALEAEDNPEPPADALDSCPNIYLRGRPATVWIDRAWVNVHPGEPPRTPLALGVIRAEPPEARNDYAAFYETYFGLAMAASNISPSLIRIMAEREEWEEKLIAAGGDPDFDPDGPDLVEAANLLVVTRRAASFPEAAERVLSHYARTGDVLEVDSDREPEGLAND